MNSEVLASLLGAIGTVLGAGIVAVAGGFITRGYQRERDRQDKEAEWRNQALELTKLDQNRKLEAAKQSREFGIRPSVLTFLANYRDVSELDSSTPADLYWTIMKKRIASSDPTEDARQ